MKKRTTVLTATGLLIVLLALGFIFWKTGSWLTGINSQKTDAKTNHAQVLEETDGQSKKTILGVGSSKDSGEGLDDTLDAEAKKDRNTVRAFGGIFLQENKQPVPGARVYLLGRNAKDKRIKTQTQTSDQNGSFEFKDLAEGQYRIYAKGKGLISHSQRKDVTRFTVDNETQSIGPVSLFLEKAQVLQVQIRATTSGEPIPGAQVKILSQFEETHTADGQGIAEIYLTAEIWNMEISATGFGKVKKAIDLWANPVTIIEVSLEAGGSVAGKAVDEKGAPVGDVYISLNQSALRESEKTDSEGNFRFDHLSLKSPFSLSGYQKGYQAARLSDQNFESGQVLKNFTLVMREPEPIKDPLTLKVRVTNDQGAPVAKASVNCRAQGPMGTTSIQETDSKGICIFEGLNKHSFGIMVSASADGYAPKSLRHRSGPETEQDLDVTLEPARSLSGTVYDGTGDPIEGVTVNSSTRFPNQKAPNNSDENGSFSLENLAKKGSLSFSKRGYSSQKLKYEEEDSHLEVVLKGLGTLHGQVVDETSNEPIKAFTVKLKKAKWDRGLWATQGIEFQSASGSFRIPDLPVEKTVTLTITAEGYVANTFEEALPIEGSEQEGETYPLSNSGLTLNGTLVNSAGTGRPGIPITVLGYLPEDGFFSRFSWRNFQYMLSRPGTFSRQTTTDAQGVFEFQGLPDDLNLDLLVFSKGLAKARMKDLQNLLEAERQAVLFKVEDESILQGKVNREVYPKGSQIRINGNGQFFSQSLQVSDTTFSIDQLPSGTYSAHLYTTSPQWKSIDSKEVVLKEAEVTEVLFGFEDQYEVSGLAFINGRPASEKSLFLLPTEGTSGTWKTTLTDQRGYFSFPENKPGHYDLILTHQAVPHYQMLNVLRKVPNRHPLEVIDTKVEGDYHFEHFGTLKGRVVSEQKNLTLAILTEPSGTEPYRAKATASLEGFFQFEQVPPGTFALRVSGDFRGTDILASNLIMPDDGSDLDLGDLPYKREGKLQIVLRGQVHPSFRGFWAYFFDPGITEPEMSANAADAQRSVSARQIQTLLEGLPTGPMQVILKFRERGFSINPNRALVTLDHDQPVQLQVEVFPVTSLVLSNRSKKQKFISATIQQGDQVLHFNYRQQFGFAKDFQERVPLLTPNGGTVKGLAEGRWELSVQGTEGGTHNATVTLKKGHSVRQEIYFE